MATYSKSSPYYGTGNWGQFLDVWAGKAVPPDATDALYEIDKIYENRPDMLAYDLYQDNQLWWVFAVRNPDVIRDPVLSFSAGKVIYVPTKAVVQKAIGL
jgi:hypothetical protein